MTNNSDGQAKPSWLLWAQAGGIFCVLLLVLAPVLPGFRALTQRFEKALYDVRVNLVRSETLETSAPPIVIVGLDEQSRTLFPESRTGNGRRIFMARVLNRLADLEVNLVGVDLFWNEPSSPESDLELASALANVDAVLATDMVNGLVPIDVLRQQEVSEGFVNLVEDNQDGVVRDVLMWHHRDLSGENFQLPLSLEMASLYWHPEGAPAMEVADGELVMGDHRLPQLEGSLRPRFNGPQIPVVPVSQLFEPGFEEQLKGALVLVGTTSRLDKDEFLCPINPPGENGVVRTKSIFGVELHGWILRSILARDLMSAPGKAGWWIWSIFWVLLLWVLGFWIAPRPLIHTSVWLLAAMGLIGSNLWAFSQGYWLPLSVPLFALVTLGGAGLFYRRARDVWEKKQVENMFGHYLSPNLVEKLLEHPEYIRLGGSRRTLTILFSDLRGFTAMSERLDPETVSNILNEYFTEMVDILFAQEGTLDKFMGDAIMAFFGDPVPQEDHTRRAVQTAVDMQIRLEELRKRFKEQGKPAIWAGIGINTGEVVVGNQGGSSNFDYTVIGDAVNLASRLESKAPKNQVLVSKATYDAMGKYRDQFQWEKLDPIMVKGKTEPVEVYLVRIPGVDYNDRV